MISRNTQKYIILMALLVICTGCGLNKSNPLDDYRMLDLVPEGQSAPGADLNQFITIENQSFNITDVEQANQRATDNYGKLALQNAFYQVSTNAPLHFLVDQESTFELTVQFRVGQVRFEVEPSDLPESNMSFELISQEDNISKYRVQWKPSNNFIDANLFSTTDTLKLNLKNMQYVSADARINQAIQKSYEELSVKTAEVSYIVRKDNQVPTLVVNGLGQNIQAGSVQKFSVDVTAPSNYSSQDPLVPVISFDSQSIVNTLGLVEASGADFVYMDSDYNGPERLANGQWRVHYVFDATRELPQQYDRTLRAIEGFDKLYVNLSFQIDAQDRVAVSDKTILRFYIER